MFKNIVFTLVTLALFLLCLEGGVRLFFPVGSLTGDRINLAAADDPLKGEPVLGRLFSGCFFSSNTFAKTAGGLIINRPRSRGVMLRTAKTNYVFDQDLDKEKIANLTVPIKERTTFAINQQSMRGGEIVKDYRPRLLLLGDSITFGYYVNDKEAYPAQLQKLIPSYQVLNAGVSSYNADEEWRYLQKYTPQLQPQIVGVGFYLNDVFSMGKPLMVKEYNFFFPYRQIPGLWRLSKHSRLVGLIYERLLTLPYFYQETIDPGQPENASVEFAWRSYEKLLGEMKTYTAAHHMKLFIVIFPNAFQLSRPATAAYYQQRVLAITRKLGIPTLDLFPAFAQSGLNLYQPNDTIHPNATGHKIAAQKIAGFILRGNLLNNRD